MYTVFAQYQNQPEREYVPAFVCQTLARAQQLLRELDRLGFAGSGAFISVRQRRECRL